MSFMIKFALEKNPLCQDSGGWGEEPLVRSSTCATCYGPAPGAGGEGQQGRDAALTGDRPVHVPW